MKVVIKGRISITQMKQVEDFVKNIKEHDMVDVKHKRCIHEWCNICK
jgi:hypothetical protein